MEANMDNPKNLFIKIGDTRIKLNNIKNYGVSETHHKLFVPIGEYRRKIWLSDYTIKRTCKSDLLWKEGDGLFVVVDGDCGITSDKSDETLYLNETYIGEEYIDMAALHTEYVRVKAIAVQKGNKEKEKANFLDRLFADFGQFRQIEEELSQQELIIKFDEDGLRPSHDLFTKGKLYYDGKVLRCEGSPIRGIRVIEGSGKRESCYKDRIFSTEKDLIESGELSKISYKEVPKQEDVVNRYLYITTYQNDNFQFTEDKCDIDAILKKLDDNLEV